MKAKHTPGPWHNWNSSGWRIGTEDGWPICFMPKPQRLVASIDETIANAKLIAAAPDLLEACKAIAALADGQGAANMMMVAGQARAAVAKAEGGAS